MSYRSVSDISHVEYNSDIVVTAKFPGKEHENVVVIGDNHRLGINAA